MKFETRWQRNLHIAVNPKSVVVESEAIYVTERFSKLSKICVHTGQTIWSQTIPGTWGWTTIANDRVYYMAQIHGLYIFCAKSGKQIDKQNYNFPYNGYVKVSNNLIVTGGWRGHTNLTAISLITKKTLWSYPTKSAEIKEISVPYFLDKGRLLIVNHSTNYILIINTRTGKLIKKVMIPDGIKSVDLGRPYCVLNNQLAFLSSRGKLYLLDIKSLSFTVENLPLSTNHTNLPYFFSDKMVFRDSEHTYSLFDRSQNKILRKIPIAHNTWTEVIAAEITDDRFVIAGSYGTMKVVSRTGETLQSLPSEKRITTPLHNIDGHLIYGTKGSLKSLKYQD